MKESPEQQLIWEKYVNNLNILRKNRLDEAKKKLGGVFDGMFNPADFGLDDELNPIDGDEEGAIDGGEGSARDGDEQYGNKMRGPGDAGVSGAGGFLRQALAMIENKEIHLCADREALKITIKHIDDAKNELLQNVDEIPGE